MDGRRRLQTHYRDTMTGHISAAFKLMVSRVLPDGLFACATTNDRISPGGSQQEAESESNLVRESEKGSGKIPGITPRADSHYFLRGKSR